jgi:hypothetical protein
MSTTVLKKSVASTFRPRTGTAVAGRGMLGLSFPEMATVAVRAGTAATFQRGEAEHARP